MILPSGITLVRGYLSSVEQKRLDDEIESVVALAPYFVPRMWDGTPFKVRCTNMGPLGWCADEINGYHYSPVHLVTGNPWPPITPTPLAAWRDFVSDVEPECCLVNDYAFRDRLGMHPDDTEDALQFPVVSVAVGSSCLFRIGGFRRDDPSEIVVLHAGDALVLGGESRLRFHGVEELRGRNRKSCTLRRVTQPHCMSEGCSTDHG